MKADTHGCIPTASVIGEIHRGIFPFKHFNRIQSECLHLVYGSDKNVAISLSPFSGKSVSAPGKSMPQRGSGHGKCDESSYVFVRKSRLL